MEEQKSKGRNVRGKGKSKCKSQRAGASGKSAEKLSPGRKQRKLKSKEAA